MSGRRRFMLTHAGQKYVQENLRGQAQAPSEVTGENGLHWDIYYDSKRLVLARRSALIRERNGILELHQVLSSSSSSVPLLPGDSEASGVLPMEALDILQFGVTEVNGEQWNTTTDATEIIRRLTAGAPPLQKGATDSDKALREILEKHHIRPLVRLKARTEELSSSATSGVAVKLDSLQFDTLYAEPAAISAVLADSIPEAAELSMLLRVVIADIRTAGGEAATVIDKFLKQHKLDEVGGGAQGMASALEAYLRLCRPVHLEALKRAGIELSPPSFQDNPQGVVAEDASESDRPISKADALEPASKSARELIKDVTDDGNSRGAVPKETPREVKALLVEERPWATEDPSLEVQTLFVEEQDAIVAAMKKEQEENLHEGIVERPQRKHEEACMQCIFC